MNYLLKPGNGFYPTYEFKYEKPVVCPYCSTGTDAPLSNKHYFYLNGYEFISASAKCTACGKEFFFACHNTPEKKAKNVCLYPSIQFVPYQNEILASISERFIDIYNQALLCEFNGIYELAAIGYRSALEILVKDFAINELNKSVEEVSNKNLHAAIGEYLNQHELINTADVIRILGNDYTHYQRRYPQHDFDLLKGYMDIFLKQIEVKYMINHPPVFRTP